MTFFKGLISYLELFAKLDLDDIAFQIANSTEHKKFVIRLNTEGEPTSQLFNLGEDSLGVRLHGETSLIGGEYSPSTLKDKRGKGQQLTPPTLKDTGAFYDSFKVVAFKGGFRIEANPIKDDTNLFDEFGEEIVGLNKENLDLLTEFYLEKINEILDEIRGKKSKSL